jgi:hypothetical protein
MVYACYLGNLGGVIRAAIVDDDRFDYVDPVDRARQRLNCLSKDGCFVIAGDLDN